MRKTAIICAIIFIIVFSSGCASKGVQKKNVEEDYHKGTQGLSMKFMANAPPDKIYAGDKMEAVIELENKGAYPDTDSFVGKIELYGFERAAINGQWDGSNTIPPRLRGKSQYNPEGTYDTKTFSDSDGVRVPFDYDSYTTDLVATSCYKYKTIANPSVCVDPDPYKSVQEKKACAIKDITLDSQGAPIKVSKVEEEVSSDKIYFRIFINNAGTGSVILPDRYNSCPFDIEHNDLDKVVVRAKLSHDASPSCTPKGTINDPVRLVNKQGVIFCSFSKPGTESAYQTPLDIEVEYVYSESITKKIEIVNLK